LRDIVGFGTNTSRTRRQAYNETSASFRPSLEAAQGVESVQAVEMARQAAITDYMMKVLAVSAFIG
jgi:hypothetical protein